MPSAGMRKRVAAIPGVELPFGLLNGCTTVLDVTDVHEMNGVEWLAVGCNQVRTTTWCPPDDSTPPPKDFDSPGVEAADPVTLYAAVECSAPGYTLDDAREQARQTLLMGRQAALEEWFWQSVIMGDEVVDLTPAGGAAPPAAGVGALEGHLAALYGGVGVLHVPAGLSAVVGSRNVLLREGGRVRSLLGNCAVLGAGYSVNTGPDGDPAPDGEAWLAITGPVVIRREPVNELPDSDGESVNITNNDREVIAEQTYVPGTTCVRAAIRVCVPC